MSLKNFQLNLEQLRPWLTFLVVVWLLGTFGLGWLVNSLLIICGLFLLTPVVGYIGMRWWLQNNLVANHCPVCGTELTGLKNSRLSCPSCGEQLSVKNGEFDRFTPDGTIDVTAVEVPRKSLGD
jgi:predicted RNA-binding Zn-ribbon protein involved in translation (DUF1610 family)